MSKRDDAKELGKPLEVVKKPVAVSTDLTLREYVDFLQACEMCGEDSKAELGNMIRKYILFAETRLSSKKS